MTPPVRIRRLLQLTPLGKLQSPAGEIYLLVASGDQPRTLITIATVNQAAYYRSVRLDQALALRAWVVYRLAIDDKFAGETCSSGRASYSGFIARFP